MKLVTIIGILAVFWQGIDSFSVDKYQKKIDLTNQSRVKRQLKDNGKNSRQGQAIIEQPGLGRSVCLGCLYYGTTDYVSRSEHFWDSDSLKKADIEERNTTDFDIVINTNTLDRLNKLSVDASLALSFMGGLVKVSGSAEYLGEKRKKTNSVSMSYFYEYTSKVESLNQKLIRKKDYNEMCDDVGKPGGPTHVVSKITRGQRAVFSFSQETKDESTNSKIAGALDVVIRALPSIQIEGSAKINISETETITAKDLKCSLKSDFAIKELPTNYVEAVRVYKSLIDLQNFDTSTVLKFELQPIQKYCGEVESILTQISASVLNDVQRVLLELEKLELVAVSLTQSKAAYTYTGSLGKAVNLFLTELRDYASTWKENLKRNLPFVRGGDEEARRSLDQSLREYEKSPFSYNTAAAFLKNRKTELDTVKLALNEDNVPGIIIDDGTADVNKCSWKSPYEVKYELNILPKDNIVQSYMESVRSTSDWTEPSQWYDDEIDFNTAASVFSDFIKYRIINAEKKNVCFYVKLNPIEENDKYAKIVAYNETGRPMKDDFRLVNLESPEYLTVTSSSISFDVSLTPDEFTNTINIQIKRLTDNDDGEVRAFPMSPSGITNVKINQLSPDTPYQFKISAASKIGSSSYLKEFKFSTNAHSEPQNLRILKQKDSALQIGWEKPNFLAQSLTISAYDITVYESKNSKKLKKERFSDVKSNSNEYSMEISGLEYSSRYNIEVVPRIEQKLKETEQKGTEEKVREQKETEFQSQTKIKSQNHIAVTRLNTKAEIQATTTPRALMAPSVIDKTHHTISLQWDPPKRILAGSKINSYTVKYERVDPKSGEPLINGGETISYADTNEIILKDLAAGGTFRIQVAVDTTDGSTELSAATLATTPMIETELDVFRKSLNLGTIEKKLGENEERISTLELQNQELDKKLSATKYSHKLLISSTGAAKEVQETSLGIYELTGQISNDRPVYMNTKDKDRYLHFSTNSNWIISTKNKVGSVNGFIYNDAGGEAPHEADQNKWLVYIPASNPIKDKYTLDDGGNDWYKDPTFSIVPVS